MGELPTNVSRLVSLLRRCRRDKDLPLANRLFAHIQKHGVESQEDIGNHLVPMLVDCGALDQAQQAFNKFAHHSEYAWTSVMSGYIACGEQEQALILYYKMQEECVQPSSHTFSVALKACAGLKRLDRGQRIHKDAVQMGCERDLFVGNSLVDMYAKCGFLEDALDLLEKLPVCDVVAWTAILAGYIEHENPQEAIHCYELMQEKAVLPNAVTLICSLRACASSGSLAKGLEMHASAVCFGYDRDFTVANTLIGMYGKCNALSSAQEVFSKLPIPDGVSWNALITGYAENEWDEDVLKALDQMQVAGIPPNEVTFICGLKACGKLGSVKKGHELHGHITARAMNIQFVGNALVDMYAKCGMLVEAEEALGTLTNRDAVSWNGLILGYSEKASAEQAFRCFEQMQAEGIAPDSVTLVCILKACNDQKGIERGQTLHFRATLLGLEQHGIVGSALVDMYARNALHLDAQQIFDNQPDRSVMMWTALIAGYAEHGPWEQALRCYVRMQTEGTPLDPGTFACLMKACGNGRALSNGYELHVDSIKRGFERDLLVGSSLIDMYAKFGSISEACKVFEALPVRDAVSWSAMIRGYGINHEGNMAVECFQRMQEQGVKLDDVTFICLLSACSHTQRTFKAQELFKIMRDEHGFVPTEEHFTCLVDLLAKSGHLQEAENYSEGMSTPPVWTALLDACRFHGESSIGQKCFEQLT